MKLEESKEIIQGKTKEGISSQEFQEDSFHIQNNIITIKCSLQLNNLDLSLIPDIRKYFYKNLNKLKKYEFFKLKVYTF